MNIDEQFESFLAELGVEMERPEDRADRLYDGDSLPEVSIFQASRNHYGVFYRLDIIERLPELRIMVPVEHGDIKMDIYLVRLSERTTLNTCIAEMSVYHGSGAFERGREATMQHLLYAVAEMMKQLFWAGDLQRLSFSPEIEVYPLLLNHEEGPRRKR